MEKNDNELVPSFVTIFPPVNSNADVTDEDSGDENQVLLHNLPGSQLRAPAEIDHNTSDESEDEIPLAQLSKRPRIEPSSSEFLSEQAMSSGVQELVSKTIVPKNKTYNWISRDIRPVHLPWKPRSGASFQKSPLYYFECMFDNSIIQLLVLYTNLYATQKNKVGNVTSDEMKCFIGILLYSGYVIVPRRFMYWENGTDCGMSIVYNAMSRDRFTYIMTNFHVCDNTQLRVDDKFSKLRPLFDALNQIFQQFAPFEEFHSVDEAMVPYYGGHPCKQFIRGKPIRWGYKFWVGATRLGYIIWFSPYQGQGTGEIEQYRKLGLGATVILQYSDVLRRLDPNAPFHLCFDNFFSSVPLFEELRTRGFKATGTIRENRVSKCPLPTNKNMQKTERGSFEYRTTRAEEILVCKWNDNNVVTVCSNSTKVMPTNKVKRFSQKQKKHVLVDQPTLIKLYNENMGGVDRSDQNIGLYRISIRGKKWYFSLISHCLDMAVQNAWQLYRSNDGEYDQLKFRRSVATSLLESYGKSEKRKPGRSSQAKHETSRYDEVGHIIKYRPEQLRCGLCHKHANFYCKKCAVTLHPKHCFEMYHTP